MRDIREPPLQQLVSRVPADRAQLLVHAQKPAGVRVGLRHADRGHFKHGPELGLAGLEGVFGLAALRAVAGGFEGPRYGGDQAAQPLLEHVVGRPADHALHGLLLAQRARNQNERGVGPLGPHLQKRVHAVEVGQAEVGEDHVERALGQGPLELRAILRQAHLADERVLLQLVEDQLRIERVVLEVENENRILHGLFSFRCRASPGPHVRSPPAPRRRLSPRPAARPPGPGRA